jgi:hypothetical protein
VGLNWQTPYIYIYKKETFIIKREGKIEEHKPGGKYFIINSENLNLSVDPPGEYYKQRKNTTQFIKIPHNIGIYGEDEDMRVF